MAADRDDLPPPAVKNIADAERWIAILWRWACQDAKRMNRIEERLDERRWWQRKRRRRV